MSIPDFLKPTCFFVALLFLVSCQKIDVLTNTNDYRLEVGPIKTFYQDSLGIYYSFHVPNLKIIETDSAKQIITIDGYQNSLDVYDYISGKFLYRKRFDVEGERGVGKIVGFCYVSPDTVFLISPYGRRLSLVSLTDTTVMQLSEELFARKTMHLHTLHTPLVYAKGILNIGCSTEFLAAIFDQKFLERKQSLEYAFDMVKKELHPLNIDYPESYRQFEAFTTPQLSRCYNPNKKLFAYSFPRDHNIYVRKLGEESPSETHHAQSSYFSKFEQLSPRADMNEVFEFNVKSSTYEAILYDTYRHVYYRLVYIGTEELKHPYTNEMKHPGESKEFSIIILDEEFNIVGETRFPADLYSTYTGGLFVAEEGLYISNHNEFRKFTRLPQPSEGEASFTLLKLVKNE